VRRIVVSVAIAVAMVLVGIAAGPKQASAGGVIPNGALMVSTSNGLVQEWDTSTTPPHFVVLLDTGSPANQTIGSVFDVSGNFFVADLRTTVSKFDPTGALIGNFGSGYNADPASVMVNALSDVFVGEASITHDLLEFDPTGVLINTFAPTPGSDGTDLIDLAADQCTMFYTSEDTVLRRFNVCTNLQLPDFNLLPLPGTQAYANKIRANGEVVVADMTEVTRLDAAGNQIDHYSASSIEPGNTFPFLFALSLDRDGKSFWVGDFLTDDVFKVDIASGTVITQFNAAADCNNCGVPNAVSGLAMKGEIQVSNPPPVCTGATASAPNLSPPNHKFVTENVLGVTDVSGPFTINIDGIRQDEQVFGEGSGNTCPDGKGVGTHTAMVLAERDGRGDGRVYHIAFTATDNNGNTCQGNVKVCVPHDQGHEGDIRGRSNSESGSTCVDEGALFDSTVCPPHGH
jgi:outer membrane protein assembly factor BamB